MENKKCVVLFISTNADEAGAPRLVETIIRSLSNKWDPCCAFGEDGPVSKRLSQSGYQVYFIPELKSRGNFIFGFKAILRLCGIINETRPHLVNCHSFNASVYGRIASFLKGVPCIYTVHGWGWRGLPTILGKIVILVELILTKNKKTKYIYVAEAVQKDAQKILKLSPSRGEVIHNGVVINQEKNCSKSNSIIKLIMPARVCNAKDHQLLLKAFGRLNRKYKLCLCGNGTNDEEFIKTAKKLLGDRCCDINFVGETDKVFGYLRESDIFLLVSNYEALPISIIEAMGFGLPIIATNVGGVSELVVHNENGYLVPHGNLEQLVKSINKLGARGLRERFGKNSYTRYLKFFTKEKMMSKTEKVFMSAIK